MHLFKIIVNLFFLVETSHALEASRRINEYPTYAPSTRPRKPGTATHAPSLAPYIQQTSMRPTVFYSNQPSSILSPSPTLGTEIPSEHPTLAPKTPSQATETPSQMPTVVKSMLPTQEPSLIPSESTPPSTHPSNSPSVSSKPTDGPSMKPTLSQVPSLRPSQNSHFPSSMPTKVQSNKPSSTVSLTPTINFSSGPSVLASSPPSVAISQSPSIAVSQSPSLIPTLNPLLSPSSLPSIAPTSFDDSLQNATLSVTLYARRKLDSEELRLLEKVTKEFIVSADELVYVESATVISQQFEAVVNRRLKIAARDANLQLLFFVKGKMLPISSSSFYYIRVKAILDGEEFKPKLIDAMPVFLKEDDPADTKIKEKKPETGDAGDAGGVIAKIGAGIGGGGLLIIVAFLMKRKRGLRNVRLNNTVYVVEADPTTGIETDRDVPDAMNPIDAFEDRDRFSTFTYSETSSAIDHDCDFIMSLTSSSLASATLSSINSNNDYPNKYGAYLSKDDLPGPILPLQHARPKEPMLQDIDLSLDDPRSRDNQSVNSLVETEAVLPVGRGVRRMLSCFGPTASCAGVDFRHSISALMSEKTPRMSNVYGHESIQLDRNQSSISAVSSLSGKSSCSGSVSLTGEPFEVVVSAKKALGLVVKSSSTGPKILFVKPTSPLSHVVQEGDYILSVDGIDARFMSARELSNWLHHHGNLSGERTMILMSQKDDGAPPFGDDGSDIV